MNTTLIPDDRPVTLTWHSTTIEEHTYTIAYGKLREQIDHLRDELCLPHNPDLSGDLGLLEESWLGDYEDAGSLSEFDRRITGHDLPAFPELPTFTVSLDDAHGDDDPCPHTYVLHAADLSAAIRLATGYFAEQLPADFRRCGGQMSLLGGEWWTFLGAPSWPSNLAGRTWSDLRADEHMLERAYQAEPEQ